MKKSICHLLNVYDVAILGYHVPRWCSSDEKIIDDVKHFF